MLVEIEVGGGGGHPQQDGLNGYSSGMHNNANIPVEMIESELPLSITRYELLPGTAGAGRFRGGVWAWCASGGWIVRRRCSPPIWSGFKYQPYGLAGGEPGRVGALTLLRDGTATAIGSKVGNIRLRRGDIIRLETSGGGGFGPASERLAADCARDAELDYMVCGR